MDQRAWLCAALLVAASGCRSDFEGGGELRAKRVALRREVAGLRAAAARLERGELARRAQTTSPSPSKIGCCAT